jgi:hypothetical protein
MGLHVRTGCPREKLEDSAFLLVGRAFMMSQVLIAMVSAVFLLGAVDGCRKGQEEDRAVTRTKEASASLADLAREAGVTFPPSARLIGFSREAGIDDYLNFKVEIDAKDLASFLATSPISADALHAGEHGRLGPDEGYWDPHPPHESERARR